MKKIKRIIIEMYYNDLKFIKRIGLAIVFIFSSNYIFSQEIDVNRDQYKVSKDLENFIFYNSNKKIKINVNGKKIDSTIFNNDIDISKYIPIFNQENKFFVEHLGGVVFKKNGDKLDRIDKSYTHKNQLNSSLFIYNDTLFRFGGYGFFEAKNFFTYLSKETNEWEALNVKSKSFPIGVFSNKFFLTNNSFYFFGGFNVDLNNKNIRIPNNKMWKYSFLDKKWTLVTENEIFLNTEYSNFDFFYENKFFFSKEKDLYSFNTLDESIVKYKYIKKFDKGNQMYPTIALNDSVYTLGVFPNKKKNNFNIISESINSFQVEQVIVDNTVKIVTTSSLAVILLILIIFLIYKYFKVNFFEKITLNKNLISYGFKRINILEDEQIFLDMLMKNELVDNSSLLYAVNSDIDNSQKTRIKNQTINSLNIKLEILTNNRFIIDKSVSKNDKRYSFYKLKKII
ncbi:hypothetical protein N9326_03875 [Flavobacteriaceae bacterium]|nr:hypothetical protein [Flavobacteriaceae bacterium]